MESYIKFLESLSHIDKAFVKQETQQIKVLKNQQVYSADQTCYGLMAVVKGHFSVYVLSEEGRKIILYELKEGEVCVLSSSCVLESLVFEVHIEARENSEILLLPNEALKKLMETHLSVENFVLKEVAKRFTEVLKVLQDLLFLPVEVRLARFLLAHSEETSDLMVPITQEQLAVRLGTAREVITRVLRTFSKEKILITKRNKIELIDLVKLKEKAQ